MKFILISVVCLIGAVFARPGFTKQKRDILPGDPRYGTDYHHHHHQQKSNEVAAIYGPPNHVAGQPIHYQETVQQVYQPTNQYVPAPAVQSTNNAYLAPVVQAAQAPAVYQQPQQQNNNAYLAPAPAVSQTVVEYRPVPTKVYHVPRPSQPTNNYLGPANKAVKQTRYQGPVDSYGSPILRYETPAVQQKFVIKSQAPVQHTQHVVHHQVQQQSAPQVHYEHQPAPVQIFARAQESHVQQEAVQAVQEVSQVHQASQPAAVHHQITHIQPAIPQEVVYQSAPQTFSSGSFDAGFQSARSSGNGGFTYQVETAAVAAAPVFATSQVQQQHHHVEEPRTYQIPVQMAVPQVYYSPAEVSYVEDNSQSVQVENTESRFVKADAHQEQTQLVDDNGGYVY